MDNGLITSIPCKDMTFGIFKREKPTIKTFQNYTNKEMDFEYNNKGWGDLAKIIIDELEKFVKELDPGKFVKELNLQSIPDDDLIEVFTNLLRSKLITPKAVRVPLEACFKSSL